MLGFIRMLVEELWQLLDGGEGDYRLTGTTDTSLRPHGQNLTQGSLSYIRNFSVRSLFTCDHVIVM